jgi:hypothetical protein
MFDTCSQKSRFFFVETRLHDSSLNSEMIHCDQEIVSLQNPITLYFF